MELQEMLDLLGRGARLWLGGFSDDCKPTSFALNMDVLILGFDMS